MSTDQTSKPSELDRPITEDIAKQFGIPYDPANPKTLGEVLQAQYTQSLQMLQRQQATTSVEIGKARDKILGRVSNKSPLPPDQQQKLAGINKILELYPQFIDSVNITLATMVRWHRENEALMAAYNKLNPTSMLDMLGKIQEGLRASVPFEHWPENAGKDPEQLAADKAAWEASKQP